LRSELLSEQQRLKLPDTEASQVEKVVVDYFDYYRALVTDTVVEDWARIELKTKQEELKLSDELVSLIEEHIQGLA
ncbi:MAG: hypothetical protein FD167_4458, partial [bacterium]